MESATPQRDKEAKGERLLKRAGEFLRILRSQARRAFVIELTGTPKAGKSTSVVALQTFFREAGYQVHLLKERAADCPLPMKGHFFFNAWTMATMLAEVLETHETSVDLLILDRGFFDALVWLELQARRDQVTAVEKRVFSEFVLLERWRSLVDVTVIMKVEPQKALEREHHNQIVRRLGSMMNPQALAEFNNALAQVASEYSDHFDLLEIDTTNAAGGGNLLDGATSCLARRIRQELHLSTHPQPEFLGLAWDKDQAESQHFGVMFRAPVVSDYVAEHLENKQFKKMGRSGRIKSVFKTQEEIVRTLRELDLEPWSEYMARNIKLTQTKDVTV